MQKCRNLFGTQEVQLPYSILIKQKTMDSRLHSIFLITRYTQLFCFKTDNNIFSNVFVFLLYLGICFIPATRNKYDHTA